MENLSIGRLLKIKRKYAMAFLNSVIDFLLNIAYFQRHLYKSTSLFLLGQNRETNKLPKRPTKKTIFLVAEN